MTNKHNSSGQEHDDLSEAARNHEEQLASYGRESMDFGKPESRDADERTVEIMYSYMNAIHAEDSFVQRSMQAARRLVSGETPAQIQPEQQGSAWSYWYPWLLCAAAAAALVLGLSVWGPSPNGDSQGNSIVVQDGDETIEDNIVDGDDDSAAATEDDEEPSTIVVEEDDTIDPVATDDGDKDESESNPVAYTHMPVTWGDTVEGLQLGIRLLTSSGQTTNTFLSGEQIKVELYARCSPEYDFDAGSGNIPNINFLLSPGAKDVAGQNYPYLYPLRPVVKRGETELTRPMEDPVYPLGADLQSTFTVNSLQKGVIFKSVIPLTSLSKDWLLPDEAVQRTGTRLPGTYTLQMKYKNIMRSALGKPLWTGDVSVSVSYTRLVTRSLKATDIYSWQHLPAMRMQDMKEIFGKEFHGLIHDDTNGPISWLWVGNWMVAAHKQKLRGWYVLSKTSYYLGDCKQVSTRRPFALLAINGFNCSGNELSAAEISDWQTNLMSNAFKDNSQRDDRNAFIFLVNPTDKDIRIPVFNNKSSGKDNKQVRGRNNSYEGYFNRVDAETGKSEYIDSVELGDEEMLRAHSVKVLTETVRRRGGGRRSRDSESEVFEPSSYYVSNEAWLKELGKEGEKYPVLKSNPIRVK